MQYPSLTRSSVRHLELVPIGAGRLLVVLITGIYQTADGDWDFGSFWISATFAPFIVPLLIVSVIALSHFVDQAALLSAVGRYLAWLLPGLGHFYLGRRRAAAALQRAMQA